MPVPLVDCQYSCEVNECCRCIKEITKFCEKEQLPFVFAPSWNSDSRFWTSVDKGRAGPQEARTLT